MGGRYPTSTMQPKPEFNFGYTWTKRGPDGRPAGDPRVKTLAARSASFVVANWPTPILFSGVEIGTPVRTGGTLSTRTPPDNPIRMVYEAFGGPGKTRESWDLTAVLAAVRG